jgi:hypothetical protein
MQTIKLTEVVDLKTRRNQMIQLIDELFGQKIYIVFASEIGIHCDALDWAGIHVAGMDLLIQDNCPEMFTGRRPAFCLADIGPDAIPFSGDAAKQFDSLVAHEFCHVLQELLKPEPIETSEKDIPTLSWVLEYQSPDREAVEPVNGVPRHYGHGADFIRLLLHVSFRLRYVAELDLCDHEMWPHDWYRLSPLAWYRHAIGDEPINNWQRPIIEAVSGPMPEALTTLWQKDLKFWHSPKSVSTAAEVARCEAV